MNLTLKNAFEALGLRWTRRKERGATAVVIALTLVLVMGAAAFSFDTANLALQRQTLRNVNDAAAQAGAVYLRYHPGDIAGAKTAVLDYWKTYDTTFVPSVTLWCIVPSTGAGMQPIAGASSICNAGTWVGTCNTSWCVYECPPSGACNANAVKVSSSKDVPFYFAPAIGIDNGNTGAVDSVSCVRSCGTEGDPNPMDVAFVVDRTTSLNSTIFKSMIAGIKDTLTTMTPEYQFATVGAIHKSTTKEATSKKPACLTYLPSYSKNPTGNNDARDGSWMPLPFSNDYLTGSLGDAARSLNTSSELYTNLDCMNQSDQPWGTHLAAPLKSAARKLLGYDTSNLSALDAARQKILPPGTPAVKKVLIMETDGVPEETIGYNGYLTNYGSLYYTATDTSKGSTSLSDNTDPVSGDPSRGDVGCENLLKVADNAKAAGITVIMIGFGLANTAQCKKNYYNGTYSGANVRDVLAAAASPDKSGAASTANKCNTAASVAAENSDNDYYFCATTGTELAGIFKTAFALASTDRTKFVQMPK